MPQLTSSIQPQEATKLLLKKLPSRRMRDVVERRFGLKGGKRHTLDAIGKEYKITRERVRQIETDALRHLAESSTSSDIQPTLHALEAHIRNHGSVMAEPHLFATVAVARLHPHVRLLMNVGRQFQSVDETDDYRERWALDRAAVERGEKIMTGVVRDLEGRGAPVSEKELHETIGRNVRELTEETPEGEHVLAALRETHKLIRKNPYGEYGLTSWTTVNPRGVRDKAYVVLNKERKPMHFENVARAITNAGWSKKKAHPQTVHNELIKDSRFVLVGRGLYALKEWGYEPGTVKDVMVSTLKEASQPMTKDDVIQKVLGQRFVKAPTILLNLQNKSLFRRLDDGKYTLV